MFRLECVKYKDILNIKELVIPDNKVTCIIGESGSGKTTLLRLLNKMISCSDGRIFYNDNSVNAIDSVKLRREVVMLPQVPAIFPGSIKDNLLIGLCFSEKPLVNDDKLMDILKTVHLNKALIDDAEKLSGGEKQRLALGRVLLLNPDVFLLDEPSSSLDENTEKIIIEQLVNYTQKNNKTLIMVTHSNKIAESYANNIIKISNGKVLN